MLDTKTPSVAFSGCDKVQGFAVIGGETAALSCSWGLSPSELRTYDVSGDADATFAVGEQDVPLYILDKHREKAVVGMPRMSEDIDTETAALHRVRVRRAEKRSRTAPLLCVQFYKV